jgi:hypothetical protein
LHWNRNSGQVTEQADAGMLMSPMRMGIDRPGDDLQRLLLPRPDPVLCQQQCADHGSCRGWTMVKPGVQDPAAVCYLKSGPPLENANGCCTSGLKVATHPAGMSPQEGRIDRPGADFADFDLPSADPLLCQGECALNGSCRAWTYMEAHAQAAPHCWLKRSVPGTVDNGLTVSGFR